MEDQRQVKTEDGNQLSEDLEMDYFVESSAKSGLNAEKIFVKAAKLLFITERNRIEESIIRAWNLK